MGLVRNASTPKRTSRQSPRVILLAYGLHRVRCLRALDFPDVRPKKRDGRLGLAESTRAPHVRSVGPRRVDPAEAEYGTLKSEQGNRNPSTACLRNADIEYQITVAPTSVSHRAAFAIEEPGSPRELEWIQSLEKAAIVQSHTSGRLPRSNRMIERLF